MKTLDPNNNRIQMQPKVRTYHGPIAWSDVEPLFRRLTQLPYCIFLDSSCRVQSPKGKDLGRYSYFAADPISVVRLDENESEPFGLLRQKLNGLPIEMIPGLPPFQGGLAGYLSYDLNQSLEAIEPPQSDEFNLPLMSFGLYDVVLAIDHHQHKLHVVSQGWPGKGVAERSRLATERLDYFWAIVNDALRSEKPARRSEKQQTENAADEYLVSSNLMNEVERIPGLYSNFSRQNYLAAVQSCIDYIYAGDVFQVNLSQRLMYRANTNSEELYLRLREISPAPFSGYFDLGDTQIISASPERFLQVQDSVVESRPIKGTRKRTRFPEVDLKLADELSASKKDLAENTMIVDLMRNDLSRACIDDSIVVTQFCGIENYQSVIHLVSAIEGQLGPGNDVFDLLQATFPGGSITGAPKVRAMEIIQELEPSARGAYCGSMGYIGANGNCDFSILIRTITAKSGWWQISVGGGIVADSDPISEYEETWTKAAGMLKAVVA